MGVNVLSQDNWLTEKREVPFIEGAEVTFWMDYAADFWDVYEKQKQKDKDGGGTKHSDRWAICQFVKEWNFEDGEGNKLKITPEVVKQLSFQTQRWLTNTVINLIAQEELELKEKKKE